MGVDFGSAMSWTTRHEQVALAQSGLRGRRPRDFPRHAGEGCRKQVLLLARAGKLDAQRTLGIRFPELAEDFRPEHLLGDAHPDLRDTRRFLAVLHVAAQVVAQVEKSLLAGDGDVVEIRVAVSDVRAMPVTQMEL